MTNSPDLKRKAIVLRKQGLSYSEIRQQIPIAKSTLSDWLHSVGLAKYQKQHLTEKKITGQKRAAASVHAKRILLTKSIHQEAAREVEKLIRDPLWLAGTLLYWAEGSKQKEWNTSTGVIFTNMDLAMHKIFLAWSKKYLHIANEYFRSEILIHEKADVVQARKFWSYHLEIPESNIKTYLKRHNPNPNRRNVGENYHGVLKMYISKSTNLNRKIAGWTEGVIQYLS